MVSAEQLRKLKSVFDRVMRSPRSNFYREKYARQNFDPARDFTSASDLPKVPLLTRVELAATHPTDRLYTAPESLAGLRYTSGTTGAPILLSFRTVPRYRIPGRRPLVLSSSPDLNVLYAIAPRNAPPPHFPVLIGHPTDYRVTAALAEAYGIDAIVSTPSRLMRLAPELSEQVRKGITALLVASERITPHHLASLRAYFPLATDDLRYGIAESNNFIGYQCDVLRTHQRLAYHVEPDYILEIVHPDTGQWVPDGAEGETVITELYESPHPLIRYRIGDAAVLVGSGPCACGQEQTFEIVGRIGHDIVKVAGGAIRVDEIERVLGELSAWVEPDFRGVVSPDDGDASKPAFRLSVIPKAGIQPHPAVVETIRGEIARRLFLTSSKTLADFLAEGRFHRFEVTFAPGFPQEGKAKRLQHLV